MLIRIPAVIYSPFTWVEGLWEIRSFKKQNCFLCYTHIPIPIPLVRFQAVLRKVHNQFPQCHPTLLFIHCLINDNGRLKRRLKPADRAGRLLATEPQGPEPLFLSSTRKALESEVRGAATIEGRERAYCSGDGPYLKYLTG